MAANGSANSEMQKPIALLSVSDKSELLTLAKGLVGLGFALVGSGGTAKAVRDSGLDIKSVSASVLCWQLFLMLWG